MRLPRRDLSFGMMINAVVVDGGPEYFSLDILRPALLIESAEERLRDCWS